MPAKTLAAAVVTVGLCLAIGRALATPHRPISIVDFAYEPPISRQEIDGPIIWTNTGTVTHTVTFDNETIDSGPIAPSQTFSATLQTVGIYTYHCSIHPTMIGSINAVAPQLPPQIEPRAWFPVVRSEE